jgi:hypothetical protein
MAGLLEQVDATDAKAADIAGDAAVLRRREANAIGERGHPGNLSSFGAQDQCS